MDAGSLSRSWCKIGAEGNGSAVFRLRHMLHNAPCTRYERVGRDLVITS